MTTEPIRGAVCVKLALRLACVTALIPVAMRAQAELRISSPADRSIAAPGQTLRISVTVLGDTRSLTTVAIIGQGPIGASQPVSKPPYEFVIHLPSDIQPGSYTLRAVAGTLQGHMISSMPVSIAVETSTEPVSIRVEPVMLAMAVGELAGLRVVAKYSDGSTADVTRSTLTSYMSDNLQVAAVTSDGLVRAVGPGITTISVNQRVTVRIVVHEHDKR